MQFLAPFTWAIRQIWCQICFALLSVYLLESACVMINSYNKYGVGQYKLFRLEISDDMSERVTADVGTLGIKLLFKGGTVWTTDLVAIEDMGTWQGVLLNLSSSFEYTPSVDGFELRLGAGGDPAALYRFDLAGSDDSGASWSPLASSASRLVAEGIRTLDECTIQWTIGATLLWENALTWPLILSSSITYLLMSAACIAAALCGLFNAPLIGRKAVIALCALISINKAVCVAGSLAQSSKRVLSDSANVVAYALTASSLLSFEYYFPEAVAVGGIITTAARFLEDTVVFNDDGYLLVHPPISEALFVLIGLSLVWQRIWHLRAIVRRAEAVKATYDDAWGRFTARPGSPAALDRLCAATDSLSAACPAKPPRHCSQTLDSDSRSSDESFRGSEHKLGAPLSQDMVRPVASLDQLYAQAACLAPCLYRCCQAWAAASGGDIDASHRAAAGEGAAAWIGRNVIKRPERAIGKALVCYGGDVSLLTDICRARIRFGTVDGIVSCLQAIQATGSGATFLRVKSTLRADRDAWPTMGFRVRERGERVREKWVDMRRERDWNNG